MCPRKVFITQVHKVSLALLFFVFISIPYHAIASTRVALVIGNGAYKSIQELSNPTHDAEDITRALQQIGFEVIIETDSSLRRMESAVSRFVRKLKDAEVGLFYYAGHGVQVEGINYLLPVDLRAESEADVRYRSIIANHLIENMREANENNLNVVILDACRNNPFKKSRSFGGQGLARIESPSGTLIAFSTAAGDFAADGVGRNSVYTKHLLKRLSQPGLNVLNVFNEVSGDVIRETDGAQKPWLNSSYVQSIYLAGEGDEPLLEASYQHTEPISLPKQERSSNQFPLWIIGALLIGGLGGAGLLLLRPKKQAASVDHIQPKPEKAGDTKGKQGGQPAAKPAERIKTPAPDQNPQPQPKPQPKKQDLKVIGAMLRFNNNDIVLAPGPRQGIGRGECWVFSITDPHISRRPHCWLSVEQGKFMLSRDGGEVLKGEQSITYDALQTGDQLQIGPLTALKVQRIISGQAIILEVIQGPSKGKTLVLFNETISLADLLGQTHLEGWVKHEKGKMLICASQPGELPLLRKGEKSNAVTLKNGDLLEINEQQIAVRLIEEQIW